MTDWLKRLQERVPDVKILGPKDSASPPHPYPGAWAIRGPTGELAFSLYGVDEAAMIYLDDILGDNSAAEELTRRHHQRRKGRPVDGGSETK